MGRLRLLLPQSLLREGENIVRLTAQAGPGDINLVNFVRITYQHNYAADSNLLRFTASGKQKVTIGGFTSGEIRIFDVTDPLAVLELRGVVTQQKSGLGVTVSIPETGQRNLLALTDNQISRPERVALNQPSSWRGRKKSKAGRE